MNKYAIINDTYPTLNQLLPLWNPIKKQILNMHLKWNMNFIFTEIGYCSGIINNGSKSNLCHCNGAQTFPTTNASLYAQYNLYLAAMMSFEQYNWFKGMFWWNWVSDASFGGFNNSCMTVSYKPTENLLRQWYFTTQKQPPPPIYPAKCQCWL
eukprot:220823_1